MLARRPLLPAAILSGLLLGNLILGGCASAPSGATPEPTNVEQRMLAESAARIAEALAKLAIVEQSSRRVHAQAITPAAMPPDLRLRVAVDYQGDVKPLVYQLAQTVGYAVQTYGRATGLAPVNIQAEDRTIGELMADIGYQAAWRCDVLVFPERRIVELRYNPARPAASKRRARQGDRS